MNTPILTNEQTRALLEALGEAPRSKQTDELRRELDQDFALLKAGLSKMPPMPAHILNRLRAGEEADWQERERTQKQKTTTPQGFTVIQGGASSATKPKAAAPRKTMHAGAWLALAAMMVAAAFITSLVLKGDGATQPTFAWTNAKDPGQLYDVWVLPADGSDAETAPAMFVAKNVRSPVSLAQMAPGPKESPTKPLLLEKEKPHRLLVCLATVGKFGGDAVPFTPQKQVEVAAPSATAVLERLVKANRMADAQKVLNALPESVRDEPAVLEIAKKIPAP